MHAGRSVRIRSTLAGAGAAFLAAVGTQLRRQTRRNFTLICLPSARSAVRYHLVRRMSSGATRQAPRHTTENG